MITLISTDAARGGFIEARSLAVASMEAMNEGIAIVRDDEFLHLNAPLRSRIGIQGTEDVADLVVSETLSLDSLAIDDIVDGSVLVDQGTGQLRTHLGSQIEVRATACRLPWWEDPAAVIVIRDGSDDLLDIKSRSVDSAPLDITVLDSNADQHTPIYSNADGRSGHSRSGIRSMDWFGKEEGQSEATAALATAVESGSQETVTVTSQENGSTHWDRVTFEPLTNGSTEPQHIVSYIEDVTEGEEVKQQRTVLRELIDLLDDPVYAVDDDQRLLEINTAFQQFFGGDREDMKGSHLHEVVPDSDQWFQQLRDDPSADSPMKIDFLRQDGSKRTVRSTVHEVDLGPSTGATVGIPSGHLRTQGKRAGHQTGQPGSRGGRPSDFLPPTPMASSSTLIQRSRIGPATTQKPLSVRHLPS
ncbi:MAG: PAS domain S-box protein [Natrialbaceae archaeon]|nr:PAS domain S-box protein [Natrialbaceae archaeon]